MNISFSYIGKRLPRTDALEKATGEARFLSDLKFPGMLYGKILRSPLPHARIIRIDTVQAKRLPGVRVVITAEDTPGIKFSSVRELADKLPLEREKVRFIGDEVAAVAAVDQEIAEEVLALIHVDYEELPGVFDPFEALKEGAPRIHERRNCLKWIQSWSKRTIRWVLLVQRGWENPALSPQHQPLPMLFMTPLECGFSICLWIKRKSSEPFAINPKKRRTK